MTIYTIGYAGGLTPEGLAGIASELEATVIDVRASPRSRVKGFGFKALDSLLGAQYVQMGHVLGGYGKTSPRGIGVLQRTYYAGTLNCCLLCLEHDPWDCHRHHKVTGPHFPDALHIVDGVLYTSQSVQDVYENDDPSRLVAIGNLPSTD